MNKEYEHLMPLDVELTNEGIIKWLKRRVIPRNRAVADFNDMEYNRSSKLIKGRFSGGNLSWIV